AVVEGDEVPGRVLQARNGCDAGLFQAFGCFALSADDMDVAGAQGEALVDAVAQVEFDRPELGRTTLPIVGEGGLEELHLGLPNAEGERSGADRRLDRLLPAFGFRRQYPELRKQAEERRIRLLQSDGKRIRVRRLQLDDTLHRRDEPATLHLG